jgi:nitrite reductase/ring-hydroxylating ferredoxin subunit
MPAINIGKRGNFEINRVRVLPLASRRVGIIRFVHEGQEHLCAFLSRCPHLNFPLDRARVVGDTLVCPFHLSSFHLCDGENVDWVRGFAGAAMPGWSRRLMELGRTPAGLTVYRTHEDENGDIIVEIE